GRVTHGGVGFRSSTQPTLIFSTHLLSFNILFLELVEYLPSVIDCLFHHNIDLCCQLIFNYTR
ncbi:hypothetical protein, partial [Cylindrospermopsis raciborskii]